ncbi:helix-turn-helix domain-containing protein [Actinoplanes sp. NBRC 103695]|uniref:helix-turn-helix domain-containing protein n=1 Tax=Actinoplanes sp. NBRC 103695 TaxID=3032202 RepID=UPI0024A4A5F2|nr:helix-turn-helix domain-containing protein [Actinoplanes sp. NBRC 103695]GLY94055.1 XRE family transcriptional regulator [Actinoplanes sp. NBRC 103695]
MPMPLAGEPSLLEPPGLPPASTSFPDLLRHHRVRSGLTQRTLADLSTVSPRTIRDLEAGRANARTQTIHLLADGLRLRGTAREQFVQASLSRRSSPCDRCGATAPQPVDALLGRDDEVRVIVTALRSGARRMICLSGLPGVGKTRVAAEVAARLGEEAQWPVLWVGPDAPAFDMSGSLDSVIHQPALLVLDSMTTEPLAVLAAGLLARYPALHVLSTSRAPWHVPGIQATVLSPLATPDAGDPRDTPAVRLFADRFTDVRPGFALSAANASAVAEMCRRLDGLPLALETVAARGRVLGLDHLLDMPVPDLLDLTVPARPGEPSATIGGLIGATVRQLDTQGQTILRRLAQDDGTWTVAGAAAVLRRPLDQVVDALDLFVGRGLLQATHGEPVTTLRLPNLLRALLVRADTRVRRS